VCLLTVVLAAGLQQFQVRIPATGNVKAMGLGVYSDQAGTIALSSIDWGLLDPGSAKTATCYLKSLSNVNSSLALSAGNWVPLSAGNYISISLNRESYHIKPGEIISAALTLQVNSSIQGVSSFSFDVIFTAVEG
jgi:hypothetical protein